MLPLHDHSNLDGHVCIFVSYLYVGMSLFASTASDRNIAKRGALSGKRNTEDLAGKPKHLSGKESLKETDEI